MPRNPQVTTEVSVVALKGSFPGDLGIELLELDDDSVTGRLLVDQRHLHPGGYVHGGVWVAFADTVAAWGTMRNLPSGDNFTTAELKVNVFASGVVGDELMARGEPLHRGRRTQVWEVRVTKAGRLAANFICTQMVLHGAERPRSGL
jgi:1,4-dihydroxy-2-naphthoyl-CoA hydrolase